jgi:hypothetical protein
MIEYLNHFFSIYNQLLCLNFLLFVLLAIKTRKKTHLILMVYLLVIVVIQFYSGYLAFQGIHNTHISHFYFVLQFLILGYFYYNIFNQTFQKNIIKYSMILCLLILGVQFAIYPEMYFKFNNLEIFLTSYLLIIYSLFHFYNLLSAKKSFLYFNIGVFFYLFGSTVLFLLANLSIVVDLKGINAILNKVLFLFYHIFIFTEWTQLYFKKEKSNPKKMTHGI